MLAVERLWKSHWPGSGLAPHEKHCCGAMGNASRQTRLLAAPSGFFSSPLGCFAGWLRLLRHPLIAPVRPNRLTERYLWPGLCCTEYIPLGCAKARSLLLAHISSTGDGVLRGCVGLYYACCNIAPPVHTAAYRHPWTVCLLDPGFLWRKCWPASQPATMAKKEEEMAAGRTPGQFTRQQSEAPGWFGQLVAPS